MLADVAAEVERLDPDAKLCHLRFLEAEIRRLEAEIAVTVGEVEADLTYRVDGHASMAGLLRAEFRWSDADVTNRRRTARLVDDLPEVVEALWDGRVGVAQVRALGRARANPRCGDRLLDHAEILLGHAKVLLYSEFVLCVRRWEQLADVDGAHKDHQTNHDNRSVSIVEWDGVGHLAGQCGALDAAEMIEIWQTVL